MDEPPELTAEDEEAYLAEEAELQDAQYEDAPVDTGGGFCVDHGEAEGVDGEGGAASATGASKPPEEAFKCLECGDKAYSEQLKSLFGILVCRKCEKEYPERYGLCIKTTAKNEYLLADADLKPLQFIAKKNPKKDSFHAMHLYLRAQVEEVAIKKYGGTLGIEVEREKRRIAAAERSKGGKKTKGSVLKKGTEANPEAVQNDDGSSGIFQNKRPRTGGAAGGAGGKGARPVGRHVHGWGDEWCEGDIWKKKCTECGLVTKFEKL